MSLTFALGACGGGSGGSDSGGVTTPTPAPATPQLSRTTLSEVRERVVVKFSIAGHVGENETRNMGRDIKEYGWADSGFVGLVVMILQHHGLRRADLHNPFGRLDGQAFQFDQYLEAKAVPELEKVTDTFVEAWQENVTAPELGLGHLEIIGYIGSPHNDMDSYNLLMEEGEGAFFGRAEKILAPLLAVPMAVGLDDATSRGEDSLTYRIAEDLRHTRGVKVYVEPLPPADHEWWLDYPIIIREHLWQKLKDDPQYATRAQLRNELIRYPRFDNALVDEYPPEAWPEAMCRIIAEGDSLMMDDIFLRKGNRNMEGLVDCANAIVEQENASATAAAS